jgi:hypothetical protein
VEVRTISGGREVYYYARFYIGAEQHRHRLGLKRKPGEKTGLTRAMADEKAVRKPNSVARVSRKAATRPARSERGPAAASHATE